MVDTANVQQDLVRYSRAGDIFHYRWAARRCLRLIYPKTELQRFIVEGSPDRQRAGEYVVDVSEYSRHENIEVTSFFQLKHSTRRLDQPFRLSDLKGVIEGFAARFRDHLPIDSSNQRITFALISNRPVDQNVKLNFEALAKGNKVSKSFQITVEKYSGLKGETLKEFCSVFEIVDSEGDYVAQRHALRVEIASITADSTDFDQVDKIVSLIQSKVLPDSDGEVMREEVLQRFGVTSDLDLFPAPSETQDSPNGD